MILNTVFFVLFTLSIIIYLSTNSFQHKTQKKNVFPPKFLTVFESLKVARGVKLKVQNFVIKIKFA